LAREEKGGRWSGFVILQWLGRLHAQTPSYNCALAISSLESVALTQEELTIGPKVRAGPNGPALTFRASLADDLRTLEWPETEVLEALLVS